MFKSFFLNQIAGETGYAAAVIAAPVIKLDPRSAEGDQARLRGIPVIAPNVPGAIPGTNPAALDL